MTNKIFRATIEAPATADKVKSLEFVPDKDEGKAFRIHKTWIGFPNRDAIATTDAIGFGISTISQNENADLLDIDSEYEVFTWKEIALELGTNGSRTREQDSNLCLEVPGIEGTILKSGKKYFFNAICTGQDGADVSCNVKILGQYINKIKDTDLDDWHDNNL